MAHRKRPHLTSTVAAETLVLINSIQSEMNLPLGYVLDKIVHEWRENKDIEPLNNTPNSPELSELRDRLNNLDKSLEHFAASERTVDIRLSDRLAETLDSIDNRLNDIHSKVFCVYINTRD